MFSNLDPYTAEALAAERDQRFRAEAQTVRQADLAVRGRMHPLRSRLVTIVRLMATAGAGQLRRCDGARRRLGTAVS
jgi:hypothetical protein